MNQGIREINLNGNFLSAEGREAWVGSKGVGKGDVAAFLLKVLETSKALPTPAFMGNGWEWISWLDWVPGAYYFDIALRFFGRS